ncbi:MAG: MMPL family transporter [Candidatus Sericytochromatia bacterium]|nr:MMPL family transporter [Candidatus Sericytochromatia bacterium]
MKKDIFRVLGEKVIQYRVIILSFWIILTLIASIGAFNIDKILKGEGSYVKGSESYEQTELISKKFSQQYTKNIIVTLKSKKYTLSSPEYINTINTIKNIAQKSKEVGAVYDYNFDNSFISKDRKSTFLLIGLKDNSADQTSEDANALSERIRLLKLDPEIESHITGSQIIVRDMTQVSEKDSAKAEKRILPIAILLLIIVFGALVSALLPVMIAVMSIVITLGTLYVIGQYIELATFCKAITSMMGLGVGLDYCLFMVSRFREELDKGLTPEQAAIETVVTSGKAVSYSGLAVSIGMAALLIPNLILTRSIGFSGILVVAIAILLALTLLPVIFSFLGDRINSPRAFHRLVKYSSSPKEFWLRWSKTVMKYSWTFLIGGVSILLFVSYFALHMKLWNSSVVLMPEYLDSRQGFMNMMEIDPSRKFSPIGISFETKDGSSVYEQKNIKEIYKFAKKISDLPEITRVLGLVDPKSDMTLDAYNNLYANTLTLQTFQLAESSNPFVSNDGKSTILWALHKDTSVDIADWYAVKKIRLLRNEFASTNFKIMIGGGGSTNVDFQDAVYKYFPLIIALIIIATYIIMFSLLGSILLPIKAILMNLLSVTASYGWLVLVFQYGFTTQLLGIKHIPGALLIITPLVLFCIIFGLSMDYEIFMMSRIKEEYDKTGDPEQAVAMGLEKSGSIITSAALIMVIVFSAFSFSEVILVQEMGLGLSTAVLIDSTIIRIMIVPSILKLLGKAAWWLPKGWKEKLSLVKLEH